MKRLSGLGANGDTIVEVLIVLAVLSLSFSISLATANHGLTQSHNAEEHSQALGILNSQVEELRSATSNQIALPTTKSFCMTNSTTPSATFGGLTGLVSADASSDDYSIYDNSCKNLGKGGFYNASITYVHPPSAPPADPTQDYYDVRVRWDGAGGLGKQQEEFTYKIHQLTAEATVGVPVTGAQSQVAVKEIDIPALPGDYTPPCSTSGSLGGHANTQINLSDTTDGSFQTGSTSAGVVTFTGQDLHHYSATVTAGTTPPGWQLCSISGSVTPNGNTKEIDFYIRPLCSTLIGAPYDHRGPPEIYSYASWWWHTSDQVNNGVTFYRDYGPGGFNMPGFVGNGSRWQAYGVNPANDVFQGAYGYGQQVNEGTSWPYYIDPSAYFAGTTGNGVILFQDYDYGKSWISNNNKWYNFFEYVTTATDEGNTDYGTYGDPYQSCPS